MVGRMFLNRAMSANSEKVKLPCTSRGPLTVFQHLLEHSLRHRPAIRVSHRRRMAKIPNRNERRIAHLLKMQLKDFRRKFGRDPLPGEPMFFDPKSDTPEPISESELDDAMQEFAKLLPPHFSYAYRKTGGLLLTEDNKDSMAPEDRKAWMDAVDEYWRLHDDQEGGERN